MRLSRYLGGAIAFAAAGALTLGSATPAAAQPTGFTFSSGFQVQNLSQSTAANISIAFYPLGASASSVSVDQVVAANGQATFVTLPSAVTAGFDGSAVISSDQRVAAIVNVTSPDSNISFGGGSYVGVTSGAPSLNLPLLKKNSFRFNSFFNVQNVGSAPATVTVTYSGGGLSAPVTTSARTIQPGAASRFSMLNATDAPGVPDNFSGSAIVNSTGSDVAAVVTEVGPTTMLVYNGIPTGTTNPVMPLVNVQPRNGLETGIAVQNTGTAETTVTVSYSPSAAEGTACTETQTIPAKGVRFFTIDTFSANRQPPAGTVSTCDPNRNATFVGSARVTGNTASQPLVAVVNQLNQRSTANKGASYSAFSPSDATDTVVFPLIQDRVFGYFTGISLYNVSDVDTPITCSFSGTTVTQTGTARANSSFTTQQIGIIGDRYNGTGVCRATAPGARIVGIANYVRTTGANDSFFVYEGTNN